MSQAFSIDWQVPVPSWVSLTPVLWDEELVIRSGNVVRSVSLESGETRWSTIVDPDGGSGHFLEYSGDLVLTDRRPDPAHLTRVVGVRCGQIVLRVDLRCMVGPGATFVSSGTLFAIGNDPNSGDMLAVVDLKSGLIVVDIDLRQGAEELLQLGDRLLVLNRTGSPGLYSIRNDGSDLLPIESLRTHQMKYSNGRLLATLADEAGDTRYVKARNATTLQELWRADAYGPACGLDGDAAVCGENANGMWQPVLRDAATGSVRWRGDPLKEQAYDVHFAGDKVLVTQTTGIMVYARDAGSLVGEIELASAVVQARGRTYVGGFRWLACGTLASQ